MKPDNNVPQNTPSQNTSPDNTSPDTPQHPQDSGDKGDNEAPAHEFEYETPHTQPHEKGKGERRP